jgi:hypothetical protein
LQYTISNLLGKESKRKVQSITNFNIRSKGKKAKGKRQKGKRQKSKKAKSKRVKSGRAKNREMRSHSDYYTCFESSQSLPSPVQVWSASNIFRRFAFFRLLKRR